MTIMKYVSTLIFLTGLAVGCTSRPVAPKPSPKMTISVDGQVALSSLMALSDGYLMKMLDSLTWVATTPEAKSGSWSKVQKRLKEIAPKNIEAVNWFALPSGNYWTLDSGRTEANVKDREYWPRLMQGQTVIGDLVLSKATGKNVAIIAVPVLRADRSVVAVLGASIYLEKLTERLKKDLRIESPFFFYAIDSKPRGALNSDLSLIFTEPKTLGPEMSRAFDEILSRQEGVVSYQFRGRLRSVLYRKSSFVPWWYAVGEDLGPMAPP